MTTIVYKDGILASDSQVTTGTFFVHTAAKIIKTNRGELAASAGRMIDHPPFIEWLNRENRKFKNFPKLSDSFEGILINQDREIYSISNTGIFAPVLDDYITAGSGSQIAVGALLAGVDAITAVKIAIEKDIYSGGEVQCLKL
jgi:ATP-dependent protease HslVU (ClpYQ) peptidase subunit